MNDLTEPAQSLEAAEDVTVALDRWWALVNLEVAWRHYLRLNGLLKAEEQSDNPLVRSTVDDSRAMNAAQAVLYVCSNLEEILWFEWEKVFGRSDDIPGRGGLDRFKEALGSEGLQIDLGAAWWWEPLRDAFTLRDCLLHGNGRLALLKAPKRVAIDRILERAGDSLSVRHDRVRVGHDYVRESVKAARAMVEAIHTARSGGDLEPPADL